MMLNYNGEARMLQATNLDITQLYQHRRTTPEMIHPKCESGRFSNSHSVIQSVADAIQCAVLKLYLQPMSAADAKSFGYNHPVSPRDIFLHETQGITPPSKHLELSPDQERRLKHLKGRKVVSKRSAGAPRGATRETNTSWSSCHNQRETKQLQQLIVHRKAMQQKDGKAMQQKDKKEQCRCPNECDSMAVHYEGLTEGLCEACTREWVTPTHCGCSNHPDTDCCVPTDPTLTKVPDVTPAQRKGKRKRLTAGVSDDVNGAICRKLSNEKTNGRAKVQAGQLAPSMSSVCSKVGIRS